MLRVRYPNGRCVTYNGAANVQYRENGAIALLADGGGWVAIVAPGSGAIIEYAIPCAIEGDDSMKGSLQRVLNALRGRQWSGTWEETHLVSQLKDVLQRWHRGRHGWI